VEAKYSTVEFNQAVLFPVELKEKKESLVFNAP